MELDNQRYEQDNIMERENKKEYKELLKELGVTEDYVKAQISNEVSQSIAVVNVRRDIFRRRLKLYNNQMKKPDKVDINSLYITMAVMIALYYSDEMTVSFSSRFDYIVYDERSENVQNVAEFDQTAMNLAIMNYIIQWDRLFYGLGIRQLIGWEEINNQPIFDDREPMSWLPDPKGWLDSSKFRYMWFEITVDKDRLYPEQGYFNVDKISSKDGNPEIEANKQAQSESAGIWVAKNIDDGITNFDAVEQFTIFNGVKCLVVLTNEWWNIVKMEKCMAFTKKQEEHAELVTFPVILNYLSPQRGNPFGLCVGDTVEDKQRALSKLFNLNIIKATKEALGGLRLYDSRAIRNRSALTNPTVWTKRIGVNTKYLQGASLWNVVHNVDQQDRINPDTGLMQNMIQQQIESSTAIDALNRWQRGTGMTAREVTTWQHNANMNLVLWHKINNWGEKAFWTLWYNSYVAFLPKSQKKFIRLNTGFWIKADTLKRDEFIGNTDPFIEVMSKSEKEQQEEQQKMEFMALYPVLMQDPETPVVSKRMLKRKSLQYSWIDRRTILTYVPPTAEELKAKLNLSLLDNNERLSKITDINEDHQTYLVIYQTAKDNKAKENAIEERTQAYILSWQREKQQAQAMQQQAMWWSGWWLNQMQQQMGNGVIQNNAKENSWVSLQDVGT